MAVNVFLLVLVLDRQAKSRSYEERAREEVVALLKRSGISVSRDILPKECTLAAMTVPRDEAAEAAQAAALLGEGTVYEADGAYSSPLGSLRFYSDGAFSFAPAAGAFPAGGVPLPDYALEVLEKLGVEGSVADFQRESDPMTDTVTVALRWKGVPVQAPHAITVAFQAGCLTSAAGYRLAGTPAAGEAPEPLSVVSILLRLLEHIKGSSIICREITAMTPGYQLNVTQGSQPRLVPVWHLVTDTGEYALHTVTGELMGR